VVPDLEEDVLGGRPVVARSEDSRRLLEGERQRLPATSASSRSVETPDCSATASTPPDSTTSRSVDR